MLALSDRTTLAVQSKYWHTTSFIELTWTCSDSTTHVCSTTGSEMNGSRASISRTGARHSVCDVLRRCFFEPIDMFHFCVWSSAHTSCRWIDATTADTWYTFDQHNSRSVKLSRTLDAKMIDDSPRSVHFIESGYSCHHVPSKHDSDKHVRLFCAIRSRWNSNILPFSIHRNKDNWTNWRENLWLRSQIKWLQKWQEHRGNWRSLWKLINI